jgi:chromosome partitioning protein
MTLRKLVIGQHKGGVGKTTVARIVSEGAARRGISTLVIDLDYQGNYSKRHLKMDIDPTSPDGCLPPVHPDYNPDEDEDWNGRSSSADIYFGRPVYPYPTDVPNLDVLPADGERLRRVELVAEEQVKERVHDQLARLLDDPGFEEQYQLVVIDTSPSKGPLTVAALRAATHMLIPTQMEPQSIEGLMGMLALWRRENRAREIKLELIGILPNLFRKRLSLHEQLLQELKGHAGMSPYIAPVLIGQRAAFAESDALDAKPRSVFDQPENNEARREATAVLDWVLGEMSL